MVEPQLDDNPHIQELLTWYEGARQLGIGNAGLEIDRPFIPDPEIEALFEDIRATKKLLAALFPNGNPQVDPETIRKKYTKVFLILLLTGNGRFIAWFVRHDSLCDRYLPFRSRPAGFPNSTTNGDFFPSFCREQWAFCARIFQFGIHQHFDAKDLILPIISKEKLGGGGSAIVHKINLHPAYNKLGRESLPRDGSTDGDTHTFVLKTYHAPDAERYYNNEVSGFLNIRGYNVNIVGFHGSFYWGGTYNVLLEYADRGTLENYFNTTQPPSSGEDIMKFYRELFKTLPALVAIHGVQLNNSVASSDSPIFQGYFSTSTLHGDLAYNPRWHQDVKPSNILVKSKKSGSPYDCEFKLADLGSSHFKMHVPSQGVATDKDTYGTRAYGAPECYRPDGDIDRLPLQVKQGVDVWSLGCVLSEAAVWVVYGQAQLLEYRRRRGMENARTDGFRDGDCFHDGRQVLATVTDIHKALADDKRVCDHVTTATVKMVTDEMLIEPNCRTPANSLCYRTKRILESAESKLRSPAGTGSLSGINVQSPPRTPPEPPPGHPHSRSSGAHDQYLPLHKYAGSPGGISNNEDETHHQEFGNDFFGKRASQQARCSDWPTQPQITGLVDQGQASESHLNRVFSEVSLSQENPVSPFWQEALDVKSRRHRITPDPFLGANTSNGCDTSAQDQRETYNVSQCNASTAPSGGVSRTTTATLVQDPRIGSRLRQQHSSVASRTRPAPVVSTDSYRVHLPMDSQARQRPTFLSVTAAQQWKSDKKEHRAVRLTDDNLLVDLNERDHVFLIDNSSSMHAYRNEVQELFGLLGYIVKSKDPDGIEIRFTMSCTRKDRARNTGQLLSTLKNVPYSGTSNIRSQLGEILQDYHAKLRDQNSPRSLFNRWRSPRLARRQVVYILTDGVWQPECDPAPIIKDLVDSLLQNHMQREQFGIQFIRFGNDPDGIIRLNQLDSGLGLSMDIVDTEPSHGNVYKMLLGAVNNWFDDDDVNSNSSAVAPPIHDSSPIMKTSHHVGRRSTHTQ